MVRASVVNVLRVQHDTERGGHLRLSCARGLIGLPAAAAWT